MTVPVAATLEGVMAPSAKVIAGFEVGAVTVPETPFAVTTETLVTDPPELDTAAQVPSPRQYVEADAPVPPFNRETGRLPEVAVARESGVERLSDVAVRVSIVSDVRPVSAVIVLPRETVVAPIVIELFASFAFVIAPLATVVAMLLVPLPVTSPVRVTLPLPLPPPVLGSP